jgi:oxidoreductase family protein
VQLEALTFDVRSNRSSAKTMPTHNDPRPVPPARPSPDDCCKGSCDPCIFDVYDDALDRYRSALQAWEERQAQRKKEVP